MLSGVYAYNAPIKAMGRCFVSTKDAIAAEIPALRRYARGLLGDAVAADDLVQDTIERALDRWHLWRPLGLGGGLRAWLFTILHNLHVNQARGRARGAQLADIDPDTRTHPTATASADSGLALRDLRRALDLLPLEQRQVLLLVAVEGLAYRDIARILDVPQGTVMSRLSRARERLRRLLDGEEAMTPPLRRVK